MTEMPRHRTEGLIVEELHGELLIYDLERDKAHTLNGTSAAVWNACDGARSVEQIAKRAFPEEQAEIATDATRLALQQLSDRHLLEESTDTGRIDRRQLLRRAALVGAAGLALPVIKSIVAPTAAQAGTCSPSGAVCSAGAQCCSGVCVETPPGSGTFLCA